MQNRLLNQWFAYRWRWGDTYIYFTDIPYPKKHLMLGDFLVRCPTDMKLNIRYVPSLCGWVYAYPSIKTLWLQRCVKVVPLLRLKRRKQQPEPSVLPDNTTTSWSNRTGLVYNLYYYPHPTAEKYFLLLIFFVTRVFGNVANHNLCLKWVVLKIPYYTYTHIFTFHSGPQWSSLKRLII